MLVIVRITVLASESAHFKCGSKRGQSQLSNQHVFCPAAFNNIAIWFIAFIKILINSRKRGKTESSDSLNSFKFFAFKFMLTWFGVKVWMATTAVPTLPGEFIWRVIWRGYGVVVLYNFLRCELRTCSQWNKLLVMRQTDAICFALDKCFRIKQLTARLGVCRNTISMLSVKAFKHSLVELPVWPMAISLCKQTKPRSWSWHLPALVTLKSGKHGWSSHRLSFH